MRDSNNVDVEVFIREGGSIAVVRQLGSTQGTHLTLNSNNVWVSEGSVPFSTNAAAFSGDFEADDISDYGADFQIFAAPVFNPMWLVNIQRDINIAIAVMENQFYTMFSIDRNALSEDNRLMVLLGVTHSIDDNMFFGVAQWRTGSVSPNNYFYLRAKTITTTFFIAYFGVRAGVNAANAVRALGVAGASGTFALATAPTGAGGVAGGVVATGALVTAAGSALLALGAGAMMTRSADIFGRDMRRLNSLPPKTVNDIHHLFNKPGHNLDRLLRDFNGDKLRAHNAILDAAQRHVTQNNLTGVIDVSRQITVNVAGHNVVVRGAVIDGIFKIGTAFIP